MLRLTLLLALVCRIAIAQEFPQSASSIRPPAAPLSVVQASRQYQNAIRKNDWHNAAIHALVISSLYQKEPDFQRAVFFDSLAVAAARRMADTPMLQKALDSYVRSLSAAYRLTEARQAIQRNDAVFEKWCNTQKCHWHHTKAAVLFRSMQNDDAVAECRKGLLVAAALRDTAATMQLQTLLCRILVMKGKVDSVHLAYEAFDYFRHTAHFSDAAQAASAIGFTFIRTANPDEALSYYRQAGYFFTKAGDRQNAVQMQMNEGDAWLAKKDFAAAKLAFAAGQRFFEQKQQPSGLVSALIRMVQVYTESDRYDSANHYLKEAERLAQPMAVKTFDFIILGLKLKLHLKESDFKNVQVEGKKAMALLQPSADTEMIKDLSGKLEAGNLLRKGETKKGNRFLQPESYRSTAGADTLKISDSSDARRIGQLSPYTGWRLADDSGIIARNNRVIQEVEARYQKKENELQIATQQQQLKISLLEAAQNKEKLQNEKEWSTTIVVSSVVIILLVATGLWVQYRNRRRAERDKAQIEELQKEIHHRVTNNLGVINAMVEMAAKASASQLTMSALKTRIDSIALVHRLLYSGKAATGKIALQPYFEALSIGIATIFESNKPIKITINAPVETDSLLAEKLGLMVNELITNSFKYAFTGKDSGTIHLYARLQPNELYLTVADNGSGLPEDSKKGQGSKLIKGICHQLKGRCSYQNAGGAFFEMTVPV